MITKIVIHPNIFDLENIDTQEKGLYLNNLITWCKFCRPKNSIVIFDKQNKLEKEISLYINNEKKVELKKQLTTVWQFINTNIYRSKLSSKQFIINDKCKHCFQLIEKCKPEMVLVKNKTCIDKHCEECINALISNDISIQCSNIPDTWIEMDYNYSDIPEKYDFNAFVEYTKIKELIRYSKDFTLYDKNIIPEETNKISENYIHNLDNFFKLFKGCNTNFDIITYIKRTQLQQSEENIKETINIINGLAESNKISLILKVLIGEDDNNQYMEQIHNRYIFTNIVNYSVDRGLDIINKYSGLNRSFDINIINYEKAKLFKNYLNSLKQY